MIVTTTEDRGLVHRQAQPAARPGYDLIVFDTTARGDRRFRARLGPQDEFKPSLAEKLLRSDRAQIGYTVSRDRHVHVFGRSLPTIDGTALPVTITLDVSVGDPRQVVERLDLDPLKRLENEAARQLARAIRSLRIEDIDEKALDVERIALDHPLDDELGCRRTCAEMLAALAPSEGLVLHRIVLEWSLPDEFVGRVKKVHVLRNEREVEARRRDHDHELSKLDASHDHELSTIKEEHAYLASLHRQKRQEVELAATLRDRYRSAIAGKVIEAVENRSTGSLPTLLHDLENLQGRLQGFSEQDLGALPENGSQPIADGEAEGLLGVLGRLLAMAEDSRYEAGVRRRLLAAGLRALAAAIDAGDGAPDGEGEAVPLPSETLQRALAELVREDRLARNEDRQLLLQLADSEALRELGWKGLDGGA